MPFLDKVLPRLDRVDRDRLEAIFKTIAGERDFLEKVFDFLGEGVAATDREGRITFINRAADSILGLRGEDVAGRKLGELAGDSILRTAVEEALRNRVGVLSRELGPGQNRRDSLVLSAAPIEDDAGKFKGMVFMMRNTTAETLRQLRYGQLRQLQTFGIITAGIAHEIGNPLNSLGIHLQLIERRLKKMKVEDKGELIGLIEVAGEEIRRLEHIIGRFLRAARPESHELKETEIVPLLDKTLDFMKPEIERHNISLEKSHAEHIPPLMLDPDGMRQVFINLVRNAIQAMPGGGSIKVVSTYSRGHVMISVSDSGGGIADEQRERIFEPYYTTRAEGTGLGLVIVQRIVGEHGGEVLVSSSPGRGATMTVKLPVPARYAKLLPGRKHRE